MEKRSLLLLKNKKVWLFAVAVVVLLFVFFMVGANSKTNDAYGVKQNGALQVRSGFLRNQSGQRFQLRGISSHGLSWFPEYTQKESIESVQKEGANVFRSAMYTAQEGNYIERQEHNKQLLYNSVDRTIAADMYAIVDWHTLRDHDPNTYLDEALVFFDEAAARYANSDAVIYEICNEPNSGTTWKQIKTYAEKVIPVIRKHAPKAVILVGVPQYCTDLASAMKDPLDDPNVMYTFHYYTGMSSIDYTIKSLRKAKDARFPVFVSEWGFSYEKDGKTLNEKAAKRFLDYLNVHHVSWVNWSLSNKEEEHAAIRSSSTKTADWNADDLSVSGRFVFHAWKR